MSVISIENVKKNYPNFSLGEINLEIESGMIIGLIGENGAGKTTLLKLILDIIKLDSGNIKVFGKSNKDMNVKNDIGVVMDNMFYPEILNSNNIDSINKSCFDNYDSQLFFNYLKQFNIDPKQNLKTLSKGNRKKVEIASALAHKPKLLILDEPTSGLDPNQVEDVRALIKEIGKTRTVIISTHILSEVEMLCSRVIIISGGKLVADSPTDQLRTRYGNAAVVRVNANATEAQLSESLKGIEGIQSLSFEKSETGATALIAIQGDLEIRPAVAKAVLSSGYDLYELSLQRNSLEDVFHILTTGA